MTRDTLRRRRGNSTTSSSLSGVTATAGATLDDNASGSKGVSSVSPPTASDGSGQTPKTVEQVLKDEEESFSTFLKLSAVLVFAFFFMIRTTILPPNRRVYAVILDAGSTGTRAQIFEFVHNETTDHLVLRDTKMHSIKKSIAALGTGVGGTGNQFFKPLLDNVKKGVPGVRRRRQTPIKLGATAGLRLLGTDASELALQQARTALNSTEFYFEEDHVAIMDARDEAKHGWTSVNYLLGCFEPGSTVPPVATLELGGGSVQIVHPATADDEVSVAAGGQLVTVDVLGQSHQVMASSHLGLGLLSFTKLLYAMFEIEDVLLEGNPCFRKGKTFKNKLLKLGAEGSEQTKRVTIAGDGDFNRCVASAEIVIANSLEKGDSIPPLPKDTKAHAFAFFYDRTVGYGLSTEPTKQEFLQKGKQLCEDQELPNSPPSSSSSLNGDEACAEFSYVYAMIKYLTADFSTDQNVNIRFEQYVNGHMLGWALGHALEAVEPTMHRQISIDNEPLTIS